MPMSCPTARLQVELEEDEEPLDFSDWPPDKDPTAVSKIEGRMFPIKEWSAPSDGVLVFFRHFSIGNL